MKALAAGCALALASCASVQRALEPQAPSELGAPGFRLYRMEGLVFEAPEGWDARYSPNGWLDIRAPDGVTALQAAWADSGKSNEQQCLVAAEDELATRSVQLGLANVQRNLSRFAGRTAVVQEADGAPGTASAWHGWAFATCAGPREYKVFFATRTPAPKQALDALQRLRETARLHVETP